MKLKAILLSTVLLASSAHASCYNIYQQNLSDVKTQIKNSSLGRAQKEAMLLATATNVVVLAGLSGGAGGPLVSTAAGAGMIASLYMAQTYIDLRTSDSVDEALAKKALLESSLGLLREAKAGNGPILQDAIAGINRTVSTSISLRMLADKINDQSERKVYCQNEGEVMSTAGILQTAINELK